MHYSGLKIRKDDWIKFLEQKGFIQLVKDTMVDGEQNRDVK